MNADAEATISVRRSEWAGLAALEQVRLAGGNRFLRRGVHRELGRRAVSLLARGYLDTVLLTSQFHLDDPHGTYRRHGQGMIGACFHHRLLGLLLAYRAFFGRGWERWRCFAMISASEDGELIARVFRDAGGSCVRGSASRGASEALRGAASELERGGQVYVTPDGPRGPRFTVKDGILNLSRMSGLPIVPVSTGFSRMVRLEGTWDRFEIPLPCSIMHFHVGEGIIIGPNEDQKDAQRRVIEAMASVTARADAMGGRVTRLGRAKKRRATLDLES